MQTFLRRILALVLGGILGGCSSLPSALPLKVDSGHALIQLGGTGKIEVRQTFRRPRDTCRSIAGELPVTIRRGGGRAIATTSSCNESEGVMTTETTTPQPRGEYAIGLRPNRRRYSSDPAVVRVHYAHAEFDSTEDSTPLGASMLEENSKLSGSVHYHGGDQTDWIRAKAKNASVSLVFLPRGGDANAEVFAALPGGSGVRKLGVLPAHQTKTFSVGTEDLLIRVRAIPLSGETAYGIVRRDSEATRRSKVEIVDCYGTGGGMGIALLKIGNGVQVGDGVVITASDASGKRHTLGKCTVTTVNGGEGSCELPYQDGAEWVDFKAVGVYSGGKA